jgi:hypothetical protein
MSEVKTKKVSKKMISIPGQKEKVPMYICPAGMSGTGLDLERHFESDKEEIDFAVPAEEIGLEESIKDDISFKMSFQRYRDEGEIVSPEVEDFIYQRQATKYYDEKFDRQADLTTIFKD